MDLISLQEIVLQSLFGHPEIVEDTKLLAQLIVNDSVILQTTAVERAGGDSWRLKMESTIPFSFPSFTIAILSDLPLNNTLLLGTVEMRRGEILAIAEKQPVEIVRQLGNHRGLKLELTASFSVLAQMLTDGPVQDLFADISERDVVLYVKQMYKNAMTEEGEPGLLKVSVLHEKLLLLPAENGEKATCLKLLGHIFTKQLTSRRVDVLRRAVHIYGDAVRAAGGNVKHTGELGQCLRILFEEVGDLAVLNRSIEILSYGVQHSTFADKPRLLGDLGVSLWSRFERLGDLSDLTKSIQLQEDAVLLTPERHPDKPMRLNNLSNAFQSRFDQLGDLSDLNRSIGAQEDAVLLTPDQHPAKPTHLSNLAASLWSRFDRFRDLSDLNRAIQVEDNVVLLAPDEHPDKPMYLSNLGSFLQSRFARLGGLPDLSRSIQVKQDAVLLTPDEHPDKPIRLTNLGNSLQSRFDRLGDLSDLNRAIQVEENAVLLIPDQHRAKPIYLNNLANSLRSRFDRLGDLSDLNWSIQVVENAVLLAPYGHPTKPMYLNNLGNSLRSRFDRLADISDLNRSIQVQEDAVLLTPDGHPDKPVRLNDLGITFQSRFERLGNLSDLNRSVHLKEEAVLLTPHSHPAKPMRLINLGHSLRSRFERLGNLSDLNRSVQLEEEAVLLTPDEHPAKPMRLTRLGDSLRCRFDKCLDISDLDASILRYSSAAHSISGPANWKFQAASSWNAVAQHHCPEQAMESSSVMMDLVPQLTWLSPSIEDRLHRITQVGQAVRNAAATAIEASQYDTAVEWLEQGRSVIWNQLLQLRTPYDELQQNHPEDAANLRSLSSQLEGLTSRNTLNPNRGTGAPRIDYHGLAYNREELLKRIRRQPGFDRFLLSKQFSQLRLAASKGPVVMVNTSDTRCDALVLMPGLCHPIHVPLKDVVLHNVLGWQRKLMLCGRSIKNDSDVQRLKGIRISDDGREGLPHVLERLWYCVAQPVLNALSITVPKSSSDIQRVWWCPTGPLAFLPIHAAGIYPHGPKLSDFVVSSFTPSLNALLDSSTSQAAVKPRILAVALPNESRLPGTAKEVESVANRAGDIGVTQLFESAATQEQVSYAMKSFNWVHFACHGEQNTASPTDSCLLLARKSKLTLSEIISFRLEQAELAFLSACETATGEETLEEEAVHLAAGMLLAGYKAVIATMWTINDHIAVEIADETYRLLFDEYKADYTRAAEALHFAVKNVCEERKEKANPVPLSYWVPFIHMGK